MIGDRFLTDVAFGNRLGMLTIRPEPFTSEGETKAVRAVRFKILFFLVSLLYFTADW